MSKSKTIKEYFALSPNINLGRRRYPTLNNLISPQFCKRTLPVIYSPENNNIVHRINSLYAPKLHTVIARLIILFCLFAPIPSPQPKPAQVEYRVYTRMWLSKPHRRKPDTLPRIFLAYVANPPAEVTP